MTSIRTDSRKWGTVQSLCDAASIGNERWRRHTALERLISIADTHYEFLEPFMVTIVNVICETIDEGDRHLGRLGISFWESVCKVEIQKQDKKFIGFVFPPHDMFVLKNMDRIVNSVLNSVLKKVIPIRDHSRIPCLHKIARCIGDFIVPIVKPFIEENMWKDYDSTLAAIVILGSILEGPSKENLYSLVVPYVDLLVLLMETDLEERAVYTLMGMLEFVHSIVTPDNIHTILNALRRCFNTTTSIATEYLAERALELLQQGFKDGNFDDDIDILADNPQIWAVEEDEVISLFCYRIWAVEEDEVTAVQKQNLSKLGELALDDEVDFHKYLGRAYRHIDLGLRSTNDQVFVAAVGTVSDICRAIGEKILPYCDIIMTRLLKRLTTGTLVVKPSIVSCFGVIARVIGNDFMRYLSCSMVMIREANHMIRDCMDESSIVDYVNELNCSIFEAYSGILQGMDADLMLVYLPLILDSIYLATQDKHRSQRLTTEVRSVIHLADAAFGREELFQW